MFRNRLQRKLALAFLLGGAVISGAASAAECFRSGPPAATPDRLRADYLRPFANVSSFTARINNRKVLYLKPTVAAPGKAPAIVLLHFRNGSPYEMANLTEVGRLVSDFGVWAILPDGGAWDTDPRGLDNGASSALLTAVIQDATARYPINAKRVYMGGYSTGGFMTLRYICERPDLIAAAFSVGSELIIGLDRICRTDTPVPLTLINGTNDPTVRYDGKFGVLSAPQTAQNWADRNQCLVRNAAVGIADKNGQDRSTVSMEEFRQCLNGADVDFYTVNGGGHTWPCEPLPTGNVLRGNINLDLGATATMWEFLRRFSR